MLIRVDDEGVVSAEDIGSTNGTYLNGERLARRAKIRSDDVIYVGDFKIRVLSVRRADD